MRTTLTPFSPASAEVFNPTCNTVSLAGYSVLFGGAATAPVVGDGDWSQATVVPFPSGTTLAVRHAAAARFHPPPAMRPATKERSQGR